MSSTHNSMNDTEFIDLVELDDVLISKCRYLELNDCPTNVATNCVVIGHLNIRGLVNKQEDLIDFLEELNVKRLLPDVLLLCETYLNHSNHDKLLFQNYNVISEFRKTKKGGGVSIMIRKSLKFVTRDDLAMFEEGKFESLFIEIPYNCKNGIVIGEVYRVPGTNEKDFIEKYETLICKIRQEKKKIIIGTDQNLDYLKIDNHNNTRKFFELNMENNLVPTILKPTRITHSTATLIDNIYIDANLCCDTKSYVFISDISDHLPCLTVVTGGTLKKDIKTRLTRKIDESSLRNIKGALMGIDWNYLIELPINQASASLNEKIMKALDFYAPQRIVTKKQNYVKRDPWFTVGLRVSSLNCKKKYKNVLHLPHDSDQFKEYKNYRNMYQKLRRKAHFHYMHKIIKENSRDTKKLWGILNKITGKVRNKNDMSDEIFINGIKENNKKVISDAFAKYYSEVGQVMAKKIEKQKPLTDPMKVKINKNNDSVFLFPTTCNEIERFIKKLKSKDSKGPDHLSNNILKAIYPGIIKAMYIIFNKSLSSGIFPDDMKEAIIKPLYKSKSVLEITNYRPISLLSVISKILEKIVHDRVNNFLDKHNIIFQGQYGFRKGRSTTDAILDLVGNVLDGFNKKMQTAAIFLDMTKAFDSIKHETLLKKMEDYGIRGVALDWFKSYLSQRKISVMFKEVVSQKFELKFGTPQGSVLGPLLYTILVNDMPKVLKFCKCIMFADDTTIYVSGNNLKFMQRKLNQDLQNLMKWLKSNSLSLNTDKSCYIIFNNNKRSTFNGTIAAYEKEIKRVPNTKFLGIYIDELLNWNKHVQHLSLKVSSGIYSLNMVKNMIPLDSKKLLYFANIQSHLRYALSVWGPLTSSSNIKKLQIQQNRAIRALFVIKKRSRLLPYYKQAKILNIENLMALELTKISYRYVNNALPTRIINLFEHETHEYNTRYRHFPQAITHSVHIYNKSFLARAPHLWLQLTTSLRNSESIKTFSKHFINYKFK